MHDPALRSHTHMQDTKGNTKTKACKRANFANAPMTIIGLKNVIWTTKI